MELSGSLYIQIVLRLFNSEWLYTSDGTAVNPAFKTHLHHQHIHWLGTFAVPCQNSLITTSPVASQLIKVCLINCREHALLGKTRIGGFTKNIKITER
jgi:hypothetical protein